MADADSAIERLYEDSDLRDELQDAEATQLLKWAEDQITRLAAEAPDDDAFDASFRQLRGLLKGMNRLVGNRTALDEAALRQRLGELSAQAAAITGPSAQMAGAGTTENPSAGIVAALPTLDDAGAVSALTAFFTPGAQTATAKAAATLAAAPMPDESPADPIVADAVIPPAAAATPAVQDPGRTESPAPTTLSNASAFDEGAQSMLYIPSAAAPSGDPESHDQTQLD